MIHTLLGCLFLVIAVAAIGYWLACDAPTPVPFLRALWYRLRHDPEPFAIAPDPVDEHFSTTTAGVPYVLSDHPRDCANSCCWEIRLTELVESYDWHAAEYEMRKTK